MDVSIIIVTWNSTDYLRQCLASIYTQTQDLKFEVVVVDNGSEDDCGQMVHAEFPQATFVQSTRNLGFGRANNLGVERSSGDILLFLNPDTKILDRAIEKMAVGLGNGTQAGAAGARLLNNDGTVQVSCVQALPTITNQLLDSELLRRLFPRWGGWGTSCLLEANANVSVEAISGACFMVKRDVFQKVGKFATHYFMYADDLDLSYRIRNAGYDILYLGHCEVLHYGGTSSAKQVGHFSDVMQRESMMQFFSRTRGRPYATCYRMGVGMVALMRVALLFCAKLLGLRVDQQSSLKKWLHIFRWALGRDTIPQQWQTEAGDPV